MPTTLTEADRNFLKSYGFKPDSKPEFFTRDSFFLALYMLLSGGWYGWYWMYRNWDAVRAASGRPMLPMFRALFFPLYIWPLLKIMMLFGRERGYSPRFSAGTLALSCLIPWLVVHTVPQLQVNKHILLACALLTAAIGAVVALIAQEATLHNNPAKKVHPYNNVSWAEAVFTVVVCIGHFAYH